MHSALLIFIKNIEKGKVKTRLAATVGDDMALKIYKELLRHTRTISLSLNVDRYLFYSQSIENDDWSTDHFEKRIQEGDDLGSKMSSAFRQITSTHQKCIIIGSDCASLTTEIVDEAFVKLDTNDFVIGPALDGGYYLLGMKSFHPEVFENINWSTAEVLQQTTNQIQKLQKSYALLPPLSDIDYEEDWEKYGWKIE